MEEQNQNLQKNWFDKLKIYFKSLDKKRALLVFVLAFFVSTAFVLINPPKGFSSGNIFSVYRGETLETISKNLKEKNIIKSETVFRLLVVLFGGEKSVMAGDYLLNSSQNSVSLAYRFVRGQFGVETLKITIPEGWSVVQIGNYLEQNLFKFNKKEFLDLTKSKEGYLFPDTYFVSEAISPKGISDLMLNNFSRKINSVKNKIEAFKKPEKDVIIMASILEGEALPDDRRVVAGILWKRLSLGMPLQVDSTFKYINGKGSLELTDEDLKIDSPFNTYKYKGLPPGPINNPGLDSIISAVTPTKTNYLYFLTEKDGTIHYAKTFAEHVANKNKYLR